MVIILVSARSDAFAPAAAKAAALLLLAEEASLLKIIAESLNGAELRPLDGPAFRGHHP